MRIEPVNSGWVPEVGEAGVPGAGVEIGAEAGGEALLVGIGDEAPGGLGAAHGGVEHRLRPTVEGVGEAVRAVERDPQRPHLHRPHRSAIAS